MRGTDSDVDGNVASAGRDDQSFEDELEALVLRAFGEGKDVEGIWDLEYEPDEIPDWTVTIDRKDTI
ncbi:hypothetical protein BRC82_05645 [Halobacteriales archaeon QS_1_67_19]|nr:MAG: hypothetical protein BRC82_05645 [Halobacteriales archaeon QS_1_67_19]